MTRTTSTSLVALLLLLFVGTTLVSCAAEKEATTADFDKIVGETPYSLVMFYAPWCGHCKKLKPEWTKAAEKVADMASLVKVDCTTETELATKYGVTGYPTVKLFRNGEVIDDFQGERSVEGIVKYLTTMTTNNFHVVTSDDAFKKVEVGRMAVVAKTSEGSALAAAMEKLSAKYRANGDVYILTKESVLPKLSSESVIVFRRAGEGEELEEEVLDGEWSEEKLQEFFKSGALPFLGAIGPTTVHLYSANLKPKAFFFFKASEEVEMRKEFVDLAKELRGEIIFLWVDIEKYSQVPQSMGHEEGAEMPAVTVSVKEKTFPFKHSGKLTVDDLRTFIRSVLVGDVDAALRSEPVPEPETVDGLTTIVGSTLDKHLKSGKDMFLFIHAPWCGHCKKLKPEYLQLAEKLASSPVTIAMFNGDKNDLDKEFLPVSGYPTLYFIPRGGTPVPYAGAHTEEALTEFLVQQMEGGGASGKGDDGDL